MNKLPIPFPIPDLKDLPIMAVPDLLAGFLYGMTADNKLIEIEGCYNGAEFMVPEIKIAAKDIKHGGLDWEIQAGLQLGIVALQVPKALKSCENMQEDITAIKLWAQVFKDIPSLTKKVTKNFALHSKAAKADIAKVKADYAAAEWFHAGKATADLASLLIGPIKPIYPPTPTPPTSNDPSMISVFSPEVNALGFDPMATPDFIAGLIYGFTGDNHLTEIEACYTGGQDIIDDAELLWMELKENDWVHASIIGFKLNNEIESALSTCQDLDGDIASIEAWGEIFTEPVTLSETVTKNYVLHHFGITKTEDQLSADWDAGDYFSAGADTAHILTLLIGPVQ